MSRKLTKEEFIVESATVHGDTYDYSLVVYINSKTKVKIICSTHGVFDQSPKSHKLGNGCPVCGIDKRAASYRKTNTQLLEELRGVHGDSYVYNLYNYTGMSGGIDILCKEHGWFTQYTQAHLRGSKCPKCAASAKGISQRTTQEEFVRKSVDMHGMKYDYSISQYIDAHTPVNIVCAAHGMFTQSPHNHYKGCGCPICATSASSKGEDAIRIYLTTNEIPFETQHTFDGKCRNPSTDRVLRFDFYVPRYNLCIEFDGRQHYEPFSFSSDDSEETKQSNYEDVVYRDSIKNEYCRDRGINLLRIRYDEVDRIPDVLSDRFGV